MGSTAQSFWIPPLPPPLYPTPLHRRRRCYLTLLTTYLPTRLSPCDFYVCVVNLWALPVDSNG